MRNAAVLGNFKSQQLIQLILEVLVIMWKHLRISREHWSQLFVVITCILNGKAASANGVSPLISVGFGSGPFRERESCSNVLKLVLCKQLK